jgi:hypothetical protein
MQVKYYPYGSGQDVGLAVVYPDNYTPTKKYPVTMAVHGIGERGDGRLAILENLVLGFDYNNDGVREGEGILTNEMKKAVDQYGIVFIVPNYSNFFEPSLFNWAFDFVKSLYSVVDECMLIGFSLGGGATIKAATTTTSANRIAYAIPCAAITSIVDATVPGKTNLPIHFFSNSNDPTVNVSNTKNQFNAINATNPTIRPLMTIFNRSGHGGYTEAATIAPPKAPGGQGFIDAAENIYQVYLDILKNGPRQMKSGTVIPDPDPTPTITANAGVDQTVVEPLAYLDGTKSIGYKSAKWLMIQKPDGVSQWAPVVQSGGWITTRLSFPKEGVYVFKLTVYSEANYTGSIAEDTVFITYNTTAFPPPKSLLQKVYIPINNNFVYVYDDGSTETKSQ